MNFFPRNRNLVIQLQEQKEEESAILLPEDYKKVQSGLKLGKLIASSAEGQFAYDVGGYVLFESHMMQTFSHEGKEYIFIPESSVHGVFKNGPDVRPMQEY